MDKIHYSLQLQDVTKIYSRRTIFKNINAGFHSNGIYGIAGSNGTGKSTLVKAIANIISPTSGKVHHQKNNVMIEEQHLHNEVGFLSPYFVFYEEFSAEENIDIFLKIRGIEKNSGLIDTLFDRLVLNKRRGDAVKTYSSGMKQRLKLIFALSHTPSLLILDEPTSNLDDAGKEQFYGIIKEYADKSVILVASNEKNDLALCSSVLNLEEYK
ncbi:MAG: ABC transporter ATP-binding protein [Ignavibacteriales bacterium]|nr:ABC transporter ATP-binding protein [Ignavibacteriales bacterium]